MRQRDIPKAVREVNEKLAKHEQKGEPLRRELRALQDSCKHHDHVREARAFTGGLYEADSYWYDIKCRSCGKMWLEDQDKYWARMRAEGKNALRGWGYVKS